METEGAAGDYSVLVSQVKRRCKIQCGRSGKCERRGRRVSKVNLDHASVTELNYCNTDGENKRAFQKYCVTDNFASVFQVCRGWGPHLLGQMVSVLQVGATEMLVNIDVRRSSPRAREGPE